MSIGKIVSSFFFFSFDGLQAFFLSGDYSVLLCGKLVILVDKNDMDITFLCEFLGK